MENILIFIIDRPVCLIANHKIKMTTGKKLPLFIVYNINAVDHRLIRRKDAMCIIIIFLFYKICAGKTGKQINKTSLCLRNKRITVCKE